MDNYQQIISSLKTVYSDPLVAHYLPLAAAFFVGFLMGFINFATQFRDNIITLIVSPACFLYCVTNGIITAVTLRLIDLSNIGIFNIKLGEHQTLFAILIGFVGYAAVLTKLPSQAESDQDMPSTLQKAFMNMQKLFFDRYTRQREVKLRPKVKEIMDTVADNFLMGLSNACIVVAKGIDDQEGSQLAARHKNIYGSPSPIQIKKIEIGLELVKIIGLKYFQQIAKEIGNTSLSSSIEKVETKIQKLHEIHTRERGDD